MIAISIDIGYHNLGLVKSQIDDVTFEIKIKEIFKIDLKSLPHRKVNRWDCKLEHTNEVADLVAHFIQEYGDYLEEADKILIERQPPTGLTQIETLLLYLYRHKTELISPNSMHAYFKINCLEYETRKERTIEFSESFLENFEEYQELSRKHDIADAVCMIIFRFARDKEKYRLSQVDKSLPFSHFIYQESS
jgi:hypothetical protein